MIKIRRGLDLPKSGTTEQTNVDGTKVRTVAVIVFDYHGMKPTMAVQAGDKVKLGQLLFTDKKTEGIRYTAPAAGTVSAINRGEGRVLQSVVIDVEGDDAEHRIFAGAGRLVGRRSRHRFALGAVAVGFTLDDVGRALAGAAAASPWRMEVTERADGLVVVNDAYNANPESMRAALKTLAVMAGRDRRSVAVLGEMLELGAAYVTGSVGLLSDAVEGLVNLFAALRYPTLYAYPPFNFIDLYIPSNPFYSLANNIVPAVEKLLSLNVGPAPHQGSPTTVNVAQYMGDKLPIRTSYGASQRHVVDMADHYGQLANYMRLNNILPPTALPRPPARP